MRGDRIEMLLEADNHRPASETPLLKVHPITFYIELSSKYVGVGVNFSLLNENQSGDHHFLFVFLKG